MVSDFRDLDGQVTFRQQPAPVPGRLLPGRRVALLLLTIQKCRGQRATPLQMHALDTALVDPDARKALASAGNDLQTSPIIRYDPALTRAIDRAVGFGLARWIGGNRLELTDHGKAVSGMVRSADVLSVERAAFDEIPGQLTQKAVADFVRGSRWL